MGFWLNNFAEFETKRNRENRLVLNFAYVPDRSNEEKIPRSIKLYVPVDLRVPSWFMTVESAERLIDKINQSENLGGLNFKRSRKGSFEVIEVETPNIPSYLEELKKLGFQAGDYAKHLKFGGFFPDRKVHFRSGLLERILSNESEGEIEISPSELGQITAGGFMSREEAGSLSYVILDIEKPLWKHEREKELIELRKRLLAAPLDGKTRKRQRIIGKIEERLLWDDPQIEKSGFYDEDFDAEVSYVGTIWQIGSQRLKELYVIDRRWDIEQDEHDGFRIIKFKTEKDLVAGLNSAFKKRNPLVAVGHNEVYDYSQLRYAAEEYRLTFDPSVKDVQPRRDFVRDFLQRLREDMIYIDTLWFARIKHPYLNQRRFGTSFKLAELAQHLGIHFRKSLSHEQLREVEMKRLAGKTGRIRKDAARRMIDYACGDLGGTDEVFHSLDPWPAMTEMKKVLPFATYTQIAFSPNIMNNLHEYRQFLDSGNLPYTGFKRMHRQEEIDMFKKRFSALKHKHLKKVGLEKAPSGFYDNATEHYVSVESWFLDLVYSLNPELEEAYKNLKESHEMAFLQYLKSYMVQIFSDYFQAELKMKDSRIEIRKEGESAERRFYAQYGFGIDEIRKRVREGYRSLASSIRQNGMHYLDHIGDYIIVQGDGEIAGAKRIRNLGIFEIERGVKTGFTDPNQLSVFA